MHRLSKYNTCPCHAVSTSLSESRMPFQKQETDLTWSLNTHGHACRKITSDACQTQTQNLTVPEWVTDHDIKQKTRCVTKIIKQPRFSGSEDNQLASGLSCDEYRCVISYWLMEDLGLCRILSFLYHDDLLDMTWPDRHETWQLINNHEVFPLMNERVWADQFNFIVSQHHAPNTYSFLVPDWLSERFELWRLLGSLTCLKVTYRDQTHGIKLMDQQYHSYGD